MFYGLKERQGSKRASHEPQWQFPATLVVARAERLGTVLYRLTSSSPWQQDVS